MSTSNDWICIDVIALGRTMFFECRHSKANSETHDVLKSRLTQLFID
ncbi:hypothetical protein OAD79_03780 [Flavobacteriales bacterium]|nr:hypothetical protein [Flavobacteriales bacterium]